MKIAVVTGANRGIGKEITKGLAKEPGIHVVIACRNLAYGQEAADHVMREAHATSAVEAIQCDITNQESMENFIKQMTEKHGKIDLLCNNAAIAFKNADPTPFGQQAKPTFATNYFGTKDFTNHCIPLLEKGDGIGRIVNVASFAGKLGILKDENKKKAFTTRTLKDDSLDVLANDFIAACEAGDYEAKGWPKTAYGMSKLCLIAYTRVLARHHDRKFIVNSCCPGWCATDMSSHSGPRTAVKGAETPLYLLLSPDVHTSGELYQDLKVHEW